MINISLRDNVSCENVCKKIEQKVNSWRKEFGNDLSDCFLFIDIIKIAHTVGEQEAQATLTHVDQVSK